MNRGTGHSLVCGLEIHVELATRTKVLCACPNRFGAEPNTLACPVCAGLPGALPVLNAEAVRLAVLAGLALDCTIRSRSVMARKNYFYPDMPKGYQITQYEEPLCVDGSILLDDLPGGPRRVRIERAHLEEDAGKLLHDAFGTGTLVDLNRCGVPLLEIVGAPDLRTPEEARRMMEIVRDRLEACGVSDCRMEEGSLRADVNVSLLDEATGQFGTRVEIKNVNSFRAVERAVASEARRQERILGAGGRVVRETRLWDDGRGESRPMRRKETDDDYRYFPEPDLPALRIGPEEVEALRRRLPEFPAERRRRYRDEMGLSDADALLLCRPPAVARLFESACAAGASPRAAADFLRVEVFRHLNRAGLDPADVPFGGESLARLLAAVGAGRLAPVGARRVLERMFEDSGAAADPEGEAERQGLLIRSGGVGLDDLARRVAAAHPAACQDLRAGKEKAFSFLLGQAMREARGGADPKALAEALRRVLSGPGHESAGLTGPAEQAGGKGDPA